MATTFGEAISRAPLRTFSVVTFIVCMLVLTCDGMDAQLLGIVAPKVIEDFGVDRGTFGIAMSAALVGFGLGSWAGGWLGDAVGRRWSLAIATAVFSLATIGASTADGVWQMAAWRLVSGLGFGSAYANAIALAGEWLPDRWRPVGVTTLSVGTPAGGFVIAALAPTLDAAFGWRGSFVAVGLSTLLVVVLIIALLRDSPSFLLARGHSDAAHAAARRVLSGTAELVPEHLGEGRAAPAGVFDAGNSRLNLGVGITFAAAALVAYAMLSWGTTFLTAKNFSFEQASYAVSVGGLTSVAASIAAGLLVQRFGSRIVFVALGLALFASLVAFAVVLEGIGGSPSAAQVTWSVVLYGLSAALFSGAIACLYALMTHAYPSSCRSAGIGFGIFVGRVGAVAATAFGGWLIELGDGSLVPFFAVLAVGALVVSAGPLIVDRQVPPARRS